MVTRADLRKLKKSIKVNTPIVERMLAEKGVSKLDPAVVFSAAKYLDALEALK